MALPIDFILNFSINTVQASQGINKMSKQTDQWAKTVGEINIKFGKWWQDTMPESLKKSTLQVKMLNKALFDTFNGELESAFNTNIRKIDNQFKAMWKDIEVKKIENAFTSLTDQLKFMAPQITIGDKAMAEMMQSLVDIRKDGPEGIESLNENFSEIAKTFDKFDPKQQKNIQKLFEQLAKSDKSVENIKALDKGLKDVINERKAIDELKNSFSDLFGFLPDGVSTLKQIARAAGAYTVFQDAAEAQEQMVTTLTQLGMVTKTGLVGMGQMWLETSKMTSAVLDLGMATQVSMKEATEAMAALANQRITTNIKDMQDLATISVRMGQAFGMSTEQATEFIGALYKIGGLSKTEVLGAANMMANVQDQLGLTAAEASGVANQVGSMTRTMKAFGGRVKDVQAMVKGVAKLNVAFTKVGLSADEANQMLTSMLNPDDLEKNILLFQGLGMTAGDAIGMMTGETSKLGNMDERMVKLAKSLKAQYGGNVFALKEMAQQYGMSLEQVQALSQLTAKDLEMKENAATLENQANKARESMAGQLKKIWNQLNVILQAFVLPLLNLLTPILGVLVSIVDIVGKGISWFKNLCGATAAFVDIIGAVVGMGLLALLLGFGKGLLGLVNPLSLVKKGIGGIKDALGEMVKNAKEGLKNLLKLKRASPAEDAAKGAQPAPASPADSVTKSSQGFMKTLSGMKPQQLLAIGAAIFLIAAGVALIVISIVQLAKAMKDLNPEQLNALLGMTAIIMGGMILIILAFAVAVVALGSAGIVAAPGILAVGAAIFLIAAGVAVVVLSIAYLVKTISESANGMSAFSLVVANLIPLLGGIALGITMIGMAMIMLGTYAAAGAAGLLIFAGMALVLAVMVPVISALGNSFNAIGLGIKNIADYSSLAAQSLITLRDTMNTIGGGFAANFIKEINAVADAISRLSSGSMVMAATVKIMSAVSPEAAGAEPAKAQSDAIAGLIAISNGFLSDIKTNTDSIVRILGESKDKKEQAQKAQSGVYKLGSKFSLPKEGTV